MTVFCHADLKFAVIRHRTQAISIYKVHAGERVENRSDDSFICLKLKTVKFRQGPMIDSFLKTIGSCRW